MERIKFLFAVYLAEIRNKRWSFMVAVWVLSMLAIPAVMLVPDKYETGAQIYVDTDKLLEQVLSKTTIQLNDTTRSQAQKVQQMIYASDNIRRVLKNTNLDILNKTPIEELNMVERVRENLAFESDVPDLYKITYTDTNRDAAYKILKEILNIFIETNIKQLSAKSDRAVAVSEDALKTRRRVLAEAQRELSEFKREHQEVIQSAGLLLADLRAAETMIDTYPSEKQSIQSRISQLISLQSQTQRSFSSGGLSGSLPPECDTASLMDEISKLKARGLTDIHPDITYLNELLSRKQQACSGATPTGATPVQERMNPAYLQLSEQIQDAKIELTRLKSEYELAQQNKKRAQRLMAQQPVIMEKYELLESNKQRAAQELTLAEDSNNRLQGTIDAGRRASLVNYQIIDNVTMPLKPVAPNRFALFAGALIASILGAAGYVVLRMEADRRLPTVNHLRNVFDLPVLGAMTYIYKSGEKDAEKKNLTVWYFLFALLIVIYAVFIHYYHFAVKRPDFKTLLSGLFQSASF